MKHMHCYLTYFVLFYYIFRAGIIPYSSFRIVCPSVYPYNEMLNIFIGMLSISSCCHAINTYNFTPIQLLNYSSGMSNILNYLNAYYLLPVDFSPIRLSFVNHDDLSLLCTSIVVLTLYLPVICYTVITRFPLHSLF